MKKMVLILGAIALFFLVRSTFFTDRKLDTESDSPPTSIKIENQKVPNSSSSLTPTSQEPKLTGQKTEASSETGSDYSHSNSPSLPSGEVVSLSSNIQGNVYTQADYAKVHPDFASKYAKGDPDHKYAIPPDVLMIDIGSKYPGEKVIEFSELNTNCTDLTSLKVPLFLRISGNGNITEAVSAIEDSTTGIPQSIYNCKIEGGGGEPFVTTFIPSP